MTPTLNILILSDDASAGQRLSTLLRGRFPNAQIDHGLSADSREGNEGPGTFDLIVVHALDGRALLPLIWRFREGDPYTPLISVSNGPRRESALAAGANEHFSWGACKGIGDVVESLLATKTLEPMYHQCA